MADDVWNLETVWRYVKYPKTEGVPTRGWKNIWTIGHRQEAAYHLALKACARLPRPDTKLMERKLFLSDHGLHLAERKVQDDE